MIGQIRGKTASLGDNFAILDVSGVGYKIFARGETLKKMRLGSETTMLTYLSVRENALDLYGFSNENDLRFFKMLLSVSGIGPKSALAILNIAGPETLEKAISAGDSSYLTKVSGIGKKSAQKIVLELKDKLGERGGGDEGSLKEESEVIEALKALGYSLQEARRGLKEAVKAGGAAGFSGVSERVKAALKILSNQ